MIHKKIYIISSIIATLLPMGISRPVSCPAPAGNHTPDINCDAKAGLEWGPICRPANPARGFLNSANRIMSMAGKCIQALNHQVLPKPARRLQQVASCLVPERA